MAKVTEIVREAALSDNRMRTILKYCPIRWSNCFVLPHLA
jgi:hypothetical protein